jgi:hypothetical protein
MLFQKGRVAADSWIHNSKKNRFYKGDKMSGFTSFLKKLGQTVLTIAEDASVAIPILQPFQAFLPKTVQGVLGKVGNVVADKAQVMVDLSQQAEIMWAAATNGASGTGSAKIAAMTPLVSALFQDLELIGGKKIGSIIKDPAKFNAAMQTISGAIGDALNACGE